MDRVLVTGISGFIASHVAAKLLDQGYQVRGTVRNLNKGQRIIEALKSAGHATDNLELVEADLNSDKGWPEAVKGCRYIQHIASPFPLETPNDREALVPAARAGAQRVLENGFSAGAERIVMTSSMISMAGQPNRPKHFIVTESDWTDPDWAPLQAYAVSKARAEISAWAYVESQGLKDRFVTVNPGAVLGPDLFDNGGASLEMIQMFLDREMPMMPKVSYPIVDVRDCAAIHVAAMTKPEASGRRLMAAGQTLWIKDIADVIRAEYPQMKGLPKVVAPNWLLRIVAKFDKRLKIIVADLGIFQEADSGYVTTLTGVVPRFAKEAVLASVESLRR